MTRPTTTGKAQDLIAFTRSTTGTYLDSVTYGNEQVTNGDFATDISEWENVSVGTYSLTVLSSGLALQGANASNRPRIYQQIATETGKRYKATINVTSYTSGNFVFAIDANNSFGSVYESVIPDSEGAFTFRFTATGNDQYIWLFGGSGGVDCIIDNISVKEVIGGQGTQGTPLLRTSAIDEARIEYDASGNCLGLLVEEARTNLVTYSNELLTASWSGAALSVVSSIPSIAGGQCFRLSSGNPVSNYWIQTEVASNGQTKSIWARTVSGTGTAHILGHHSVAATLVTLTEQWQRFSLPVNTSEIGGDHFYAVDFRGSGTLSEILVFGAQVEAGSFPTSYIPTSGSAVTRSSDVASLAVSDFGYNQDQGSVVVEAVMPPSVTSEQFWILGSNTSNARWAYSNSGSTNLFAYDGTNTISANPLQPNNTQKMAIGTDQSTAIMCLDGVSGNQANTNGNISSLTTVFYFGGNGNPVVNLNGHIKSVQYYPLRLSNAQLQALTV